jgi:predicted hotdog family 3-hydroxylacyl-ACP dehydratase
MVSDTLPVAAAPYMPHGEPMVLVDKLHSIDDTSRVSATLERDMLFMDKNGVMDSVAYIELIAQAVALREGYLRVLEGREIEGFLVGVKRFEVLRKAKAGDELIIEIARLIQFGGELAIITGTVYIEGELVAKGEIKIWEKV